MAIVKYTDMEKLARDIYNGTVDKAEFSSTQEAEDRLREKILEKVGGTWDEWAFSKNYVEVFQILSESLTITTSELLRETFAPFCEYRDLKYGDTIEWEVDDDKLFDVAVVADDNNNFRRQRLMGRKVPMTAYPLGVKIYEQWSKWMAGRINFQATIDKVAKSMEHELVKRINSAFIGAYSAAPAILQANGTVTRDALSELCEKVAGLGHGDITIYGTKMALSKIPGIESLEIDGLDRRNYGYLKAFEGYRCVDLKNTFNKKTGFGLSNDKLFVVPANVKPIFVGFEGPGYVTTDSSILPRLDRELEYLFQRKVHVGAVKATDFGVYNIG